MSRIILPGEVGAQVEPRLTFDGLTEFIEDLRKGGYRIPSVILVSEYDRRNLNQEILGASKGAVDKQDQRPEHDGSCIGFVAGVMVSSAPDLPRNQARLVYPPITNGQRLPKPSPTRVFLIAHG